MAMALGLAGTQAFGLREMFGTMTKPFHPGKAAQNGLLAALLARKGFTSSKQVLEAKRGFANVLAPAHDLQKIVDRWGEVYEFQKNAFKPYACGIVLHPAIDACIALGRLARPEEVAEIELRVHPYVLELTGKEAPATGLEGKFSIYHSGAVAFIDLDAAEEQYTEEKVNDPAIIAMRQKIKPVTDENIPKDKAEAVLRTKDGKEYHVRIEHATGSLENPMSQEMLERKFAKLCKTILSEKQMKDVIHAVMHLEKLESVHDILKIIERRG
jgi:2-methylcitrate dehydratase PrpD